MIPPTRRCAKRQLKRGDKTLVGNVRYPPLYEEDQRGALRDRSRSIASWPEIITDLDSLTETEIEHDGKRFIVRSAPRPAATLALRAAGVALPPTVREAR